MTAQQKRWAKEAHAGRHRRRLGGLRRLLALLLLVPTVVLQAASTTSADAAVVAGFEIDGNTPVDGGGLDWASTGQHASDPIGNADTSTFTQGAKEYSDPATWSTGTGLAPNQDDISDVYFHDAIVNDDIWGFIGFRRFTTSGVTNFDLEFNRLENSTGYAPVRSVGDVMVRFEQDGNNAFTITNGYFWRLKSSAQWKNDGSCNVVDGTNPAAGWCSVNIGSVPFTGITGESGHFGEGALNFTSLLELGGGDITCLGGNFGTMNIRTFTGNSVQSSLKDYVDAVTIDVGDTCGALEIHKVDQFGSSVGGATFAISPNPLPGGGTDPYVVVDGGANDPDGTADGFVTIDPAAPGDYTITETAAPTGYVRDTTVHHVTVGQSGVGSVGLPAVFTNPLTFKPPTIANQVVPTYDVDYAWQVHKSVDRTKADVPQGTDADFTYTVEIEALGPPAKSGFEVTGTATVTNPNTHAMVATLSTTLAGAGACTFPGVTDQSPAAGLQVDLAAGANTFGYTCAPGADPADPATTTATVTWDAATYPQSGANPTYTRSADATAAFTVDQKTDETTTVTDTFNGGAPESLGTFTWGTVWAAPDHTVVAKTYTRSLPGAPGECTDYPNTAKESADGTTDSKTVTVCVGQDLDIDKDASLGYHRTYDWDIAKSGPGTVFVGEDAQGKLQTKVRYDIDVMATGFHDSDWGLGGTITVDNPNSWPVTGTITDTVQVDTSTLECTVAGPDVQPGVAGHQVTIPAEAVDHPFAYTCAGVQQGDYVGKNTASIDWSGAPHPSPKSSDSVTVDVKVTEDAPTNKTITISDLLAGSDVTADLPQTSFDWTTVRGMTGNKQTISYEVVLGTTADACTPYKNVVTIDQTAQEAEATATICSPGVGKTVKADYGQKQLWSLDKQVDKTSVEIAEGGTYTFNYTVKATPAAVVDDGTAAWSGTVTVHNPSADTALTVDVTDIPAVQGWTCSFDDDSTQVAVAAGATVTLDYTCEGSGHADGTNTAEVSFGDQSVSTEVGVEFAARPDVADSVVQVYDDKTNPGAPAVLLGTADAKDGATEFTYSLTKSGAAGACTTYDNHAAIRLTASPDVTDDASATLCVEKPLVPTVSGTADLARTYAWSITKVADATQRTVDSSGNATFTYTVTAKAGAMTESGWQLQGSVSIANPNQYAAGDITADVTATTTVGGGAACTVTGGDDVVIAEDTSKTLPIVCTFASQPSSSGTLDVTATWDPAGEAATATATATTPVSFTVRSETNKTVQVVDDKTVAGQRVVLDPALTWAQGLVKSYTYSLSLKGGAAGACQGYTNTAMIDLPVGTDPTASATVSACTPAPEVLPEQSFGKAVGSVKASCQGTVRAKMANRSGETVVYKLRVGNKVHRIKVLSQTKKKFVTHGRPLAKVTLKIGSTRLDKIRIPALCEAPEVLPDTGLRATSS